MTEPTDEEIRDESIRLYGRAIEEFVHGAEWAICLLEKQLEKAEDLAAKWQVRAQASLKARKRLCSELEKLKKTIEDKIRFLEYLSEEKEE